jgi:hypothetical protein
VLLKKAGNREWESREMKEQGSREQGEKRSFTTKYQELSVL